MKKIKSIFVGFLLVLTSSFVFGYSGGSGTESDPYLISNKADLLELSGKTNDYDKHFKMTADIDLTGEAFTNSLVGQRESHFTGSFDGTGHIISNLEIVSEDYYISLFGYINDGTVSNLGVVDCDIVGNSTVGGLCGINFGIIINCYSTGSVCSTYYDYAPSGGLCGSNRGMIINCYSSSSVSGSSRIGGLCGSNGNGGTIEDCYSSGSVSGSYRVGGFCGNNSSGIISNCYSTANVNNSGSHSGGFCGYNEGTSVISNCYSTGSVISGGSTSVSSGSTSGGFCGYNSATIVECYSSSSVLCEAKYVGGVCGRNNGMVINCYFSGNIQSYDDYVGGVCGYNNNSACIIDSYSSGEVNGYTYVGGVCGYNMSSISNCYSTSIVQCESYAGGVCGANQSGKVSGCYFSGIVICLGDYAGGVCGLNKFSTVENCYSTGNISGRFNYIGGLCGRNYSATIIDCYSTGSASGLSYVGGLCGANDFGTISECFWDILSSGLITSGGGIGKTTVEMQTESTFTDADWNFDSVWVMNGYPELQRFGVAVVTYQAWLNNFSIPVNEQGIGDSPAGDGIQNLLKYAIGLCPTQACSVTDVMEPLVETNEFAVIFKKSKETEDVELFPTWSDSLLITNWQTSGFEFEKVSETASNTTWKATLPMTNSAGYIKLNARTN